MNRRARRAAAAKVRRTGYQHRLLSALDGVEIRSGHLSHMIVEHEAHCAFEHGRCTCCPTITRRSGDRVQVIGADGDVEEALLS